MLTTRQSTVASVLLRRSADDPDQTGYVYLADGETPGLSLTYGELDTRARAIAASLQEHGSRGDRALLVFSGGLDFVCALFGCIYAGRIAVPVATGRRRLPLARGIVHDCKPTTLLTTRATLRSWGRALSDAPELAALRCTAVDDIHDGDAAAGSDVEQESADSDIALLQYTSGSTAAPKGVMVSHQNIRDNVELTRRCIRGDERSVFLFWLPLYHDLGLISGVFQPLFANAPVYLMSPNHFVQRPGRWLAAITRFGVTISGGPNFAYDLCVDGISEAERASLDLRSWRTAINGAEVVRHSTIERFSAAFGPSGFAREAFRPGYGLAEATLVVAFKNSHAEPMRFTVDREELSHDRVVPALSGRSSVTFVGCGAPLPGHEVSIVDPATCKRCEPDRIGEIWVRGPSVTQGYWGRHGIDQGGFGAHIVGEAAEVFLRTGDLGFMLGGEVFVTGRLKDLMIFDGRNVHAEDLETSVEQSQPAIETNGCAAFSIDGGDCERLVIAAEVRGGRDDHRYDEIARSIRRTVNDVHEVDVHAVVFIEPRRLPRTTSGKLRRTACRQEFLDGRLRTVHLWRTNAGEVPQDRSPGKSSPSTIRTWMVGRIARAVGVPPDAIDARQPLDSFGLSSRAALEMSSELADLIGRPVSPTVLFEAQTIDELVATVFPESSLEPAVEPASGNQHQDSSL